MIAIACLPPSIALPPQEAMILSTSIIFPRLAISILKTPVKLLFHSH